ncbi:MAG: lipid A export permease/ATP-binding protein MsbA [Nitrospirota bacterium]
MIWNIYKRLLSYLTPYKSRLLYSILFMVITSALTTALAYLIKPVLDDVFIKKNLMLLFLLPPAIILVVTIKGASSYGRDYLLGYIGQKIVNDIRDQLYAHLTSLSFSFYTRTPTGILISRIINDANLVQGALTRAPSGIIQGFFTIVALSGYIIYLDWQLATFSVLALPVLGFAFSKFSKRYRRVSTQMQEQYGDITTHLHETIAGMRIVKAFGMEAYENKRFAQRNRGLFNSLMRGIKTSAISSPIMETINMFSIAAVIFVGGYWVIESKMTVGEFFSFMTALYLLYRPIKDLNSVNNTVQDGVAAARRIFEVLDTEPEIKNQAGAVTVSRTFSTIAFTDLSFKYEDALVLKNINLTVHAGETIAIVGKSGGGKTTFVNLIPRFYDPNSGAIRIDGRDIRTISIESLRSLMAMVTQQTILFNDTVKANIAYGNTTKPFEDIVRAAESAYADEFIRALPKGYETVIGEAGIKLSGGQRQRIAIARALLKDAPILILDEATSSLDSESEREVQKALDVLMRGRTSFVIAHRLSTILNADRIIVLKDGRIAEEGKHDDLLMLGREYKNLYEQQFREESQPQHNPDISAEK